MFNKSNCSYNKWKRNDIFWKIVNNIASEFMSEDSFQNFLNKQKECSECNRIYTRNKYGKFCSKLCEQNFHNELYQAFKYDNICKKHKYCYLTFRNECWECYKQKFYYNRKYDLKIKNIRGFTIIPTFRTSKESWNGDKIAFEQYLIDNNIRWFVYIKFYISRNGIAKPLVVGKSGSKLVNNSGSDLNFSTSVDDGPARAFLYQSKLSWYYDFIAIKKCSNEQQAYEIETKIANKYDLFGS